MSDALQVSDERDRWLQRLLDAERRSLEIGIEIGIEIGRRQVLAEEAAWRRGTAALVHGARQGTTHVSAAELDERRWGGRRPPGRPVHAQFVCACTSPRKAVPA